jgi:uncharacterized protein YdbL (DUF1318 family)
MKKIFVVFLGIIILGCAKLTVGTKDPIKVDISMRVDVYQHIAEDAQSINEQIYGTDRLKELNNLIFKGGNLYAAEISSDIDAAIERRKQRAVLIKEYMAKAYIGENKNALLEVLERNLPEDSKSGFEQLVKQENQDRMLIYRAVAEKNEAELDSVQKIFFKQDYKIAPLGSWFQVFSQESNKYIWVQK